MALKGWIAGSRLQAQQPSIPWVIEPYWSLGKAIIAREASLGWGRSHPAVAAQNLAVSFPDLKGLSSTESGNTSRAMVRAGDTTRMCHSLWHICHWPTFGGFWTKQPPARNGTRMQPLASRSTGLPAGPPDRWLSRLLIRAPQSAGGVCFGILSR